MERMVFVDREVRDHEGTARILSRLKVRNASEVGHIDEIIRSSARRFSDIAYWRRVVFLTRQKGEFIKVFYHHPSLKIYKKKILLISHMEGCLHDCLYCFLQEYQNPPLLKLFVNLEDIPARLDALLEKEDPRTLFFTAGILSDSLDLDRVTGLSTILFPYFNGKKGPFLEMRTKSSNVHHLPPGEGPNGRIILSWTITTPEIYRVMEKGTASPENRIQAAAYAQKKGYKISFHFDPIFHYPGWEEEYRQIIRLMESRVDPRILEHIGLGGFRYRDSLKKIIRGRSPENRFFLGEFVRCADGKSRYFAPIRIHLYHRISRMIRDAFSEIPIILNMETPPVWQRWQAKMEGQGL